jgi:hypothetical protein
MERLMLLPYGAEIAYRRETLLRDAARAGSPRRPRRTATTGSGATRLLRRLALSRATVDVVHG